MRQVGSASYNSRMVQQITCIREGCHGNNLKRGEWYEVFALETSKKQVRVRDKNGRLRWYPISNFDFDNVPVVQLVRWYFYDEVHDKLNGRNEEFNYVDVQMLFSDESWRWCSFTTPDYLKSLLEPRSNPRQWGGAGEPAIWSPYLIISRDLAVPTVDWTLRYMDAQNELFQHSCAIRNRDDIHELG